MKLITATEDDGTRLSEFFSSMPLPGPVNLSVHRPSDFFAHYRMQTDDYETLILLDQSRVVGMGSLIFRPGFVNDEKQTWGFATDLRIAPTRKAIIHWADHFLPAFERACEERRCQYVFSAVAHNDKQAYNALVRPTSHLRRKLPRYYLVNKFRVVNLHGRIPFSARPLPSIRLNVLDENEVEELCTYLRERSRKRALTRIYEPEDFLGRLKMWSGLKISDFRVARDSKRNIIGCAALWNGREVQTFVPRIYHGFAQTLRQSLKLGSLFGWVRSMPPVGHPLLVRFLTHINCDNAEVFHRLADDAFSRLGSDEFLTYLHFKEHWRTLPPRSFFSSSLPFGFYLILPPQTATPSWLIPNPQVPPPDFEAAWL